MGNLKEKINFKRIGRELGWKLGAHRSFFKEARGATILCYHGVCKKDHLRYNTLFVTEKMLERQLLFFKEHFNIASLDELYTGRLEKDRFTICLSFDDGFANNYQHVLPLLERYQVPAVFFVTTIRDAGYNVLWNDALSMCLQHGPAFIEINNERFRRTSKGYFSPAGHSLKVVLRAMGFEEKRKMLEQCIPYLQNAREEYWMQMTVEQIKKMAASKWATIGCHGYYHNDLSQIPIPDATAEMKRSKQLLENWTQEEVKSLAFPYGAYNGEVTTAAKEAGFNQLLGTEFIEPGSRPDATMKPRLTINPFVSTMNQAYAAITGTYR